MMKIINNAFGRVWFPFYLMLLVLLNFVGTCVSKTQKAPIPAFKNIKTNPANGSSSLSPASSKQAKASLANSSSSLSPPNKISIHHSGSEKKDQASIVRGLEQMLQDEKEHRETFSQALSQVTDLAKRDEMIASYREERDVRIQDFNARLKSVVDFNENQRLLMEDSDRKGMWEEIELMRAQYTGVSDPTKQEEQYKKQGDIVDKYNGYYIESRRQQIRNRLETLMKFVADNPSICQNQQVEGSSCVICHSTGPVGLLPCGDCVHSGCLVEKIIARFKMGCKYWILDCPGSCGNYLGCNYFLYDDEHVKEYLTSDGWQEIFLKPRCK